MLRRSHHAARPVNAKSAGFKTLRQEVGAILELLAVHNEDRRETAGFGNGEKIVAIRFLIVDKAQLELVEIVRGTLRLFQ
jgi:hypothetical protein